MLYFAYGSNMLAQRLEERLGPCACLGSAWLPGHVLRFHKDGQDGSGKCDAWRSGAPGDALPGVLYEVDAGGLATLDRIEGSAYARTPVTVRSADDATREACTYIASTTAIREGLRPFSWYKALVLAGAIQHRLPERHVAEIREVPASEDPDAERARRNLSLVRAAGIAL